MSLTHISIVICFVIQNAGLPLCWQQPFSSSSDRAPSYRHNRYTVEYLRTYSGLVPLGKLVPRVLRPGGKETGFPAISGKFAWTLVPPLHARHLPGGGSIVVWSLVHTSLGWTFVSIIGGHWLIIPWWWAGPGTQLNSWRNEWHLNGCLVVLLESFVWLGKLLKLQLSSKRIRL